ncbi:kinase-like protein, partial [Wolfiporia cocos MD-104 SS10]
FKPSVQETLDSVRTLVSSREYREQAFQLERTEARSLIGLLDEVIVLVPPPDRLHISIFHALRTLCFLHGSLPKSCTIQTTELFKHHRPLRAVGGSAEVFSAHYKGEMVAIKVFRPPADRSESLRKEAIVWKHISHPNIVPFIGIDCSENSLGIVSTWMEHGTIMTFLKRDPYANRVKLLSDVAKGLQYLHLQGILHGDIKGTNILIDGQRRARLCDFGMAAVLYDPDTVHPMWTRSRPVGSIRWTAPEIVAPEYFGLDTTAVSSASPKSDVYSFAMTMWEVFTEKIPFQDHARDATVIWTAVNQQRRPLRDPASHWRGLSDNIWELIDRCWNHDPAQRPFIDEVLQSLNAELHRSQVRITSVRTTNGREAPPWSSRSISTIEIRGLTLLRVREINIHGYLSP